MSSVSSKTSESSINPIVSMDIILSIDRPAYITISGSSVLQQLVERDLETSDIDMYVSLSHKDFSFKDVVSYIKKLYILDQNACTCNVSKISHRLSESIRKYIYNMVVFECQNKKDDGGDDINEVIENETEPEHHNYLDICSEILEVDKLTICVDGDDFVNIDLIYISSDIEYHLLNSYDLNVVRNYINNDNEIIQLYNDVDIKSNIALYDFKIFENRIYNSHTYTHLFKFVGRVPKYYKRGFEIYMKVPSKIYPCECEDTNCPCLTTLHLDLIFLRTLHVGIVAHKYNNLTYFASARLAKKFNTKLKTFYKDDGSYVAPATFYEIQSTAISTIINKMILLKELNEYSFRPDILIKRFEEFFEEEEE